MNGTVSEREIRLHAVGPASAAAYAVEINRPEYAPTVPLGSWVVTDPSQVPESGDLVFAHLINGSCLIGYLTGASTIAVLDGGRVVLEAGDYDALDLITGVELPAKQRTKR